MVWSPADGAFQHRVLKNWKTGEQGIIVVHVLYVRDLEPSVLLLDGQAA